MACGNSKLYFSMELTGHRVSKESILAMNERLTTQNTRKDGLLLLIQCLDGCDLSVLEKYASFWTTALIKTCNVKEITAYHALIYTAFRLLAESCSHYPALKKLLIGSQFTLCLQLLQNIPSTGNIHTLECIQTLLSLYPRSCAAHRQNIDTFLAKHIDSSDEDIITLCAKCRLLLQMTKGSGNQGVNHKMYWAEYQHQLLADLENVFQMMCTNNSSYKHHKDKLILEFSENPVMRTTQLYVRFHNIIKYLEIAICEPYPASKLISVGRILRLIMNGLQMTREDFRCNQIPEDYLFQSVIPLIHCDVLDLMDAVINVLGRNLKVYCTAISDALVIFLKHGTQQYPNKALLYRWQVRSKIYNVFDTWCSIASYGSCVESTEKVLIDEIFKDIGLPDEKSLAISSGNDTKTKRTSNSDTHENMQPIRNKKICNILKKDLCVAALSCLEKILLYCTSIGEAKYLKIAYYRLIRLCGLVKSNSLYYAWECRSKLYSILKTLLFSVNSLNPPPFEVILKIIEDAYLYEQHPALRSSLQAIFADLSALIHPQKESMNFPFNANQSVPSNPVMESEPATSEKLNCSERNSKKLVLTNNDDTTSPIHNIDTIADGMLIPANQLSDSQLLNVPMQSNKKRNYSTSIENESNADVKHFKLDLQSNEKNLIDSITAEFIDELVE